MAIERIRSRKNKMNLSADSLAEHAQPPDMVAVELSEHVWSLVVSYARMAEQDPTLLLEGILNKWLIAKAERGAWQPPETQLGKPRPRKTSLAASA